VKVAIVHDWLTNLGGAERVVYELHQLFPKAPIYTSVYDRAALPMFEDADVRTTYLQRFPFNHKHQLYAALRPRAFRKLDLSEYDLVISSSSAEAKQVIVRKDAIHICYCHTPIRYYWSHYTDYINDPGLGVLNPFARYALPVMIPFLRKSDYKAAQKVTAFVANSNEVKDRIKKYYDRDSVVINPPVDVERFVGSGAVKRSGFVIAGRQVAYKRIDLAVEACTKLGLDLTVIGNGPEHERLKRLAGPTIKFLTKVHDSDMPALFHKAEAFIFPALEDFGIVPVEAMAAGLPVIAFGQGGSLDYVVNGKTGLFFKEQTVKSLMSALKKFNQNDFSSSEIIAHARKFSDERFKLEIREYIDSLI
jgi:glycosyltransferase involved in cell wall biosynthesis